MTIMQTSTSRPKRIFWWFRRHKVTAMFAVLLAAFLLWFFGSWIVWDVQVNSERKQYQTVDSTMERLKLMVSQASVKLDRYSDCSYTDDGSIFATKHLGCETGIRLIYSNVSMANAMINAGRIKDILAGKVADLRKNSQAYESGDLAVYDFEVDHIRCIYVSTYYDQSIIGSSRPDNISANIDTEYIEINCGGKAKVEYFPVTKD